MPGATIPRTFSTGERAALLAFGRALDELGVYWAQEEEHPGGLLRVVRYRLTFQPGIPDATLAWLRRAATHH